jgi:predicted nucleic acid-binding protein
MWKMPSPPVASNNTPPVGLFNLRRLDLLTGVYESVAIPRAVEAAGLRESRTWR